MQVLFVPSLGLDVSLLDRLANSIDFPVKYCIAWNNGPLGALNDFQYRHPTWIVKDSAFGNLGVAGSWNEAAKLFPDEPAILLMNEDAYFLPGQLEIMCRCADNNPTAPLIHVNNTHAYYCFVWTKVGRETYGTFDENFYCAYLEDCDMRIRHRLMGPVSYPYALQHADPVPHGKPRTGGVNYAAMLQGCGLFNRAYWLRKWGSFDYENAAYPNPYRDHRLSPKEWVWYPEERAMRHHLWNTFINMPGASIYD